MKQVRRLLMVRVSLLCFCLTAAASAAFAESSAQRLPLRGLGTILLLLIVAFLAGLSLTLRAAVQRTRALLSSAEENGVSLPQADTLSLLSLLRDK